MRSPRFFWVSLALALLFAAGPARATTGQASGQPGAQRPHRLRAVVTRAVAPLTARSAADAGRPGADAPPPAGGARPETATRARPAPRPDLVPERASRPPPSA